MNKKKVIVDVFSNWSNLVLGVVVSFFVSPIIVHRLGNEHYGIWTLIQSVTGYFGLLDFGLNTAIVRYISMYRARNEFQKANEVYCTAYIFFTIISTVIIFLSLVISIFFKDLFHIQSFNRSYLFLVFIVVGIGLAFGTLFSPLLATLRAQQEHLMINIIYNSSLLITNVLIVILLLNGYNILMLAVISILSLFLQELCMYIIIRKKYGYLQFHLSDSSKTMLKQICGYSVYSFIISISLRLLFYTDSIVIGSFINVSEITFYAIPSQIVDHIEKFLWAMISVFIPIISSHDAVGNDEKNKKLYILGTKYTMILAVPIIFVLLTNGPNFITLWMGVEYGIRSAWVFRILLIGYGFGFSQLIAHGILKGISKHKVYSYILLGEAIANLLLSIALAPSYGIEGVAIGTTLPLLIVSIIIVPAYICHVLDLRIIQYIKESRLIELFFITLLASLIYYKIPIKVSSYFQLALYASTVSLFFGIMSLFFIIDREHRDLFFGTIKSRLSVQF